MRKFYVFVLATVMVLCFSAAVYADSRPSQTYGGYQVTVVEETGGFTNGAANVTAMCPDSSWVATGGGWQVEGTPITSFIILTDKDTPNGDGWMVVASDVGATSATELHVRAICTKMG